MRGLSSSLESKEMSLFFLSIVDLLEERSILYPNNYLYLVLQPKMLAGIDL
jgi:hypothetical protein